MAGRGETFLETNLERRAHRESGSAQQCTAVQSSVTDSTTITACGDDSRNGHSSLTWSQVVSLSVRRTDIASGTWSTVHVPRGNAATLTHRYDVKKRGCSMEGVFSGCNHSQVRVARIKAPVSIKLSTSASMIGNLSQLRSPSALPPPRLRRAATNHLYRVVTYSKGRTGCLLPEGWVKQVKINQRLVQSLLMTGILGKVCTEIDICFTIFTHRLTRWSHSLALRSLPTKVLAAPNRRRLSLKIVSQQALRRAGRRHATHPSLPTHNGVAGAQRELEVARWQMT